MGFGDFLGRMAGEAVKKVQEEAALIKKYMEEYDRFDDETLFERYKRETNYAKKTAIRNLLRQRGYGAQD